MENNTILEVKNVSVLMKDRFLVQDASFSLEKGSCLGIIGEDQSGKTSLIKAISGSLPISDGQVLFDGVDIQESPDVLKNINICLDPPVFFKYQSVYDNISFLLSLAGDVSRKKIMAVLDRFHLSSKKNKKVYSLSYYEKKLMALALAFITEPTLLILDEPFKNLPEVSIRTIDMYLEELRSKGVTLILTSQNFEQLEDECDNYLFMQDRKVVNILSASECEEKSDIKPFAFVKVKYPHYCGKLIMENFNLKVKLLGQKVVFEANEDTTAEIVKFFTKTKLSVYSAGYLTRKSEKIFANLAPYFKEDKQ